MQSYKYRKCEVHADFRDQLGGPLWIHIWNRMHVEGKLGATQKTSDTG